MVMWLSAGGGKGGKSFKGSKTIPPPAKKQTSRSPIEKGEGKRKGGDCIPYKRTWRGKKKRKTVLTGPSRKPAVRHARKKATSSPAEEVRLDHASGAGNFFLEKKGDSFYGEKREKTNRPPGRPVSIRGEKRNSPTLYSCQTKKKRGGGEKGCQVDEERAIPTISSSTWKRKKKEFFLHAWEADKGKKTYHITSGGAGR